LLIQAEKDVVEQMLSSLAISLLQNRVAPSYEQVMHHFGLACERAGLIATEEVAVRILKRVSSEINEAQSVLEFIGRGADLMH
jgi:chromosomal replication initiation ATPase DnaA